MTALRYDERSLIHPDPFNRDMGLLGAAENRQRWREITVDVDNDAYTTLAGAYTYSIIYSPIGQ